MTKLTQQLESYVWGAAPLLRGSCVRVALPWSSFSTSGTSFFDEIRNEKTPIIVERVVNEIDEIVRIVRFPGWQNTTGGEREVKKALRKTLFSYKLHGDHELFDRAYGYIKQYY